MHDRREADRSCDQQQRTLDLAHHRPARQPVGKRLAARGADDDRCPEENRRDLHRGLEPIDADDRCGRRRGLRRRVPRLRSTRRRDGRASTARTAGGRKAPLVNSTRPLVVAAAAPAERASGNDRPEHSSTRTGAPKRCAIRNAVSKRSVPAIRTGLNPMPTMSSTTTVEIALGPPSTKTCPSWARTRWISWLTRMSRRRLARDEQWAALVHGERRAGERIGEVVGASEHDGLGGTCGGKRRLRDGNGRLDAILAAEPDRGQRPPGRRAGR